MNSPCLLYLFFFLSLFSLALFLDLKMYMIGDQKKMEDMSERALKAANPNASAEIAKHILSLVNESTEKKRDGYKVEP